MKPLRPVFAALAVFAAVTTAVAERIEEQRTAAAFVLVGKVLEIKTVTKAYQSGEEWTTFTAKVEVSKVEQGKGVKAGETVAVSWSKRTKAPAKPVPGASGHSYSIKQGDEVRFWLDAKRSVIYNRDGVEKLSAARQDVPSGNKFALLVGVTEYKGSALAALKYTENDAEELAKVLKKSGFAVRVLTNSRGKNKKEDAPTAANVKKALADLLRDRGKQDTILIALAGHGAEVEVDDPDGKLKSKKYPVFCPYDADLNSVNYETGHSAYLVSLNDLFAQLGRCGAGSKLVLLDACRQELKIESGTRSIDAEKVTIPKGVAALFSCSPTEFAFETSKLKHGVFFHYVIKALEGGAKNDRGEVTFATMSEYVVENVQDRVPELIKKGAKQTPHRMLNVTGKSPVLARYDGKAKGKE
jgi:hypothetical protein